jgi:hypothetical protein
LCQHTDIVLCLASRNKYKMDDDERWARHWMSVTKG